MLKVKNNIKKSKKQENWWKQLTFTDNFFISSEELEEIQWNIQEKCDLKQ